MRYKDLSINKLEQLENMLNGFNSALTNPATTLIAAKDMIADMKEKIEEIKSLINSDKQD
jgi:archaellum component FlaC